MLNLVISSSLIDKVQNDGCVDAAIHDVALEYGLSDRTVYDIWKKCGKPSLMEWQQLQNSASSLQSVFDDN
jgi:hypothetical protein